MGKIINIEAFRTDQPPKRTDTEMILIRSQKYAQQFKKLENEFFRLADAMYNDFKSKNMVLGPKTCFLRATLSGFAKEVEEMIEAGYYVN